MQQQCYLGVDLGAESGRVMAGLFDGKTLKLEEVHRFPNGPVNLGGTMRWDVLRLWSEIQDGLRAAKTKYGDAIVSVGVDTWGVDFVLLSRTDEILGQPYNYRDARTQGMLQHAFSIVPKEELFANSGLQFMEINTLYQLLAMNRQNPELMQLADCFLMMPDFFHWCLSGARVVEFTNATTSQCYHPTNRDWAFGMLEKLGLPTKMFPQVVPPGTNLGELRVDVRQQTGLGKIPVIAPATHDTGAAVVGIPTQNTGKPNWAYISSGTWSLMGLEVADAILTPQALQYNVTNEGGVDGTYRLLKNIMGLWLVQGCRRSFQKAGQNLEYAELARLAGEAQPFRSLINPDDNRFLNPASMTEAITDFCRATGQPAPETPGQFVRCCLESLALKYRAVLGWLEELTGVPVEVIHIVGGGTQNELLNQFTADACGRPVLTGPVEATVMGNLLVQARSAGELSSLGQIRDVVRASSSMKTYQPAGSAQWNVAWERFQELM